MGLVTMRVIDAAELRAQGPGELCHQFVAGSYGAAICVQKAGTGGSGRMERKNQLDPIAKFKSRMGGVPTQSSSSSFGSREVYRCCYR